MKNLEEYNYAEIVELFEVRDAIPNFEDIFSIKPKTRSSVLVYDKNRGEHREKTIFRSYTSFLKTPSFNSGNKKSYMFSESSDSTPEIFKSLIDMAKKIDERFNNMVINWYEPEDYVEPHRDCTSSMVSENAPILAFNLNEDDTEEAKRDLVFSHINNSEVISIKLDNNVAYIIKDNVNYRHSVGPGKKRRVSITFRMMK